MDERRIASAVLSGLNDDLTVTPYAHGYLVSLPFFFFDDDRVKLFIEPWLSAITPSAAYKASTTCWLVSTLPATTAAGGPATASSPRAR